TLEMSGNKDTTSSFIKQIKAGVATKWQISRQQLILNANINQNWYSTFNELNHTGHQLLGQWNWQAGSRLRGELSYNNRLTLGNFQSLNRLVAANLQKRERYIATGRYEFVPDWFLRVGYTRDDSTFPSTALQENNITEQTKEFGVRYLNRLNSSLGFYLTITDGKYPFRDANSEFDNAYTRTSYNVEGTWYYSVKTRFKGVIGYTSQDYQNVKSRNFSGITAQGDVLWEVTRKSTLLLEAWREISEAGNLSSSFVLNQGVRLTPIWRWTETPLIQVELPVSYEQRLSLGTVGVFSSAVAEQSNTSIIRLNLNYIPTTNIQMTAFAAYEKRNSNFTLNSYQDQSVGLTMKVS
ncbi:MAG: outer membrane beta-barrel protein, partial [Methylococcaceae bacterium]|nr:outer membrane beta-barrel protein [Methylococcaceae bacterium]